MLLPKTPKHSSPPMQQETFIAFSNLSSKPIKGNVKNTSVAIVPKEKKGSEALISQQFWNLTSLSLRENVTYGVRTAVPWTCFHVLMTKKMKKNGKRTGLETASTFSIRVSVVLYVNSETYTNPLWSCRNVCEIILLNLNPKGPGVTQVTSPAAEKATGLTGPRPSGLSPSYHLTHLQRTERPVMQWVAFYSLLRLNRK